MSKIVLFEIKIKLLAQKYFKSVDRAKRVQAVLAAG